MTQFFSQWLLSMIKFVSFRLQHCLVPLTMWLVEGLPETGLFKHFLTTLFGVRNFRNASAMMVILFEKCWEFNLDFKNSETNWENNFCFRDNSIWIGFFRFSLLSREYLWPAFSILTNSPKILHITKRDIFHVNCLHSHQ